VSVHSGVGDFKVVAAAMVEDEMDIMEKLDVEVKKLVEEILKGDGEDAFEDE
jgi:hypothetical protein